MLHIEACGQDLVGKAQGLALAIDHLVLYDELAFLVFQYTLPDLMLFSLG